jgi:hypothetical protein
MLRSANIRLFLRRQVLAAGFFLVLAIASTWPLAADFSTHLSLGMEKAATVPLFNVWTVWWNADRAAAGYDGYWDAPMFYPTRNVFAFSEPMPLCVVAAPIIWITGNRILAYNSLLLIALWLNGWVAFHLLRRFHCHWLVAAAGGAMMEMLPLVHSWIGVLQLIPVFGILWAFLALYQFGRKPTVTGGVQLGAALSVTYLMCAYYGLVLLFLLLVCGGWLAGKRIGQWKMWTALYPGVLVCVVLCLPVVLGQYQAMVENSFARPEFYLAGLSAHVADYCAPPWPQLIRIDPPATMAGCAAFRLCPGWIKSAFMLIGIIWGLGAGRRRNWTLFCLSVLVAAFLLSLGPLLKVGGWEPYMTLVHHVPGFGQVRNVFRSAVFVQVAVALLAAMGLQAGVTYIRRYIRGVPVRRAVVGVLASAGLIAAVEIWPPPQPLYPAPPYALNHGWIDWLDTWTPQDSIVVCVPFPFKPDVVSYEQEAIWLYWGTFHHRRMPNGYSSYFPRGFLNLKMPMAEFPRTETLDRLHSLGVDYCVVRRDSMYGQDTLQYYRFDNRLEHVFRDDPALMDIYRLK